MAVAPPQPILRVTTRLATTQHGLPEPVSGNPCHAPPATGWLDRFLELFRGAERDFLTRLDLNRFAGGRIAPHAGGALANLKDAEATDANAVTLLQVLDHEADEVAENRFRFLLRHFMAAGQGGGEMLQGNGRLCGCLCHRNLLLYGEPRRYRARRGDT